MCVRVVPPRERVPCLISLIRFIQIETFFPLFRRHRHCCRWCWCFYDKQTQIPYYSIPCTLHSVNSFMGCVALCPRTSHRCIALSPLVVVTRGSVEKAIWTAANKFLNGNDNVRLNIIQVATAHEHMFHFYPEEEEKKNREKGTGKEWAAGGRPHETFQRNRKVLSLESYVIRFLALNHHRVWPRSNGRRRHWWWHINCWVRSCSWPVAKHKNGNGPKIKWRRK